MNITGRLIPFLRLTVILIAGLFWGSQTSNAANITIDTVPVGNTGNLPDGTGFGSVSYAYSIGTFEVTNAQYVAFLNAKAASDPLGLYNSSMASGNTGGISRSGSSGSYSYSAITGREDWPVNYVSWYDAIRFANWLHNGQGTGDTETGAYTLLGGTPFPSNDLTITRNPGALWFLPSENEWYKAAYHKNDGDTGNYFEYQTSSDTAPTAEPPAGGSNSANYANPFLVVGEPTNVGAYVESASPYGTYDQGGNVWEWNDTLTDVLGTSPFRGIRGGSYLSTPPDLSASTQPFTGLPVNGNEGASLFGFRVATVLVPEPSSLALGVIGFAAGLLMHVRRRH